MTTSNNYYQKTIEESLLALRSKPEGLNENESKERLKIYGKNDLATLPKESSLIKYLRQFKDLMIILLIGSGIISVYLQDYRTAIILFAIVFINSVIGFFQEYKAEKIMESLKLMVHSKTKVIRNNVTLEIETEKLVPGDIVSLEEGDAVPADLRIISENNLGTNDFALTGESNPTRKFTHAINGDIEIGDRNNLTFMGTTVATGNGKGIVIATGMNTELGRIANLSQNTKQDLSPLQKELNHVASIITIGTLILGVILFFVALGIHLSFKESLLFAIGIAASMVPQGLPAEVNISLSRASTKLARNQAIVKKLSAIETLGATQIICTDKTGTLTKNEMTVQKIIIGKNIIKVTGLGYEPKGELFDLKDKKLSLNQINQYKTFFETGIFASNAKVNPPDQEHPSWYTLGDPTEGALITLGKKIGLDPELMDKKYPELKEFSFDSVRKRMSSIRKFNNQYYIFVKGSPESILEKCTKIWDGKKIRTITKADKNWLKKKDDEFALQAMRNLAYAYKILPKFSSKITMDESESNLIFLGTAAMIDPPRAEVKAAMEAAHQANMKVIIITGDYALTAKAIARKIGLGKTDKEINVITGDELRKMSNIELLQRLKGENLIFSRTSPEDKLRIVELLEKNNNIVAVTGDGVNDAPALKKADIGVAMGKTGTDVAKQSAEIVLLDDSFSTLVLAVKEGRIIFQNLKNTILACITSNGGELFAVILSLTGAGLFGFPLAITAVQILAIDLIAEIFPLSALTWDPAQPRIMKENPRDTKNHLMNKFNILDLIWAGSLMGIIGYISFILRFILSEHSLIHVNTTSEFYLRATTLTYVTIVACQFANILSRRAGGQESVFSKYLWSNKKLLIAFSISIFCILNIIYNPWISYYFGTAALKWDDWLIALSGGMIYLLIREYYKIFRKRKLAWTPQKLNSLKQI